MRHSLVTLIIPTTSRDLSLAQQLEVAASPHVARVLVILDRQYGEAIQAGVQTVITPYTATMDADGQHQVKDLLRVLEAMTPETSMVIGARPGVWTPRGTASQLLNLTASILTGRRVRDFGSGCRVFSTGLYREQRLPSGFDHNASLTLAFLTQRYPVKWVTIPHRKRIVGKSHVQPLRDGVKTLRTILSHGH